MRFNALIISGGESKRMQCDKALLEFRGTSVLSHLASLTNKLCTNTYVVSDNEKHDLIVAQRIEDVYEEIGPLGGLYSGLLSSSEDWNLVLACDLPFLDFETLKAFLECVDFKKSKVFCIKREGRIQPLIGLYHKSLLNDLKESIENKDYRLVHFIEMHHPILIDLHKKNNQTSSNINSPTDLATFEIMKVKILCFGKVAEIMGKSTFDMITESITVADFKKELSTHYPRLGNVSFQVAINEVICDRQTTLNMNDTIALLPPFAGG